MRMTHRTPIKFNQSQICSSRLSPDMLLCGSHFYRKRFHSKLQDSPMDESFTRRDGSFQQIRDSEQLKEDVMQLKLENIRLQKLNTQLQQQLRLDEKEKAYNEIFSDFSDANIQPPNKTKEKLKQARLIIQDKQNQIEAMKKTTRFLRMQQLEQELQQEKLLSAQLGKQLEQYQQPLQEQDKVEFITNQFIEIEEKLQHRTNQLLKQKKYISQLRWDYNALQNANEKYKKQLNEKSIEFEKYKKDHEQEMLIKNKHKEVQLQMSQMIECKQQVISEKEAQIDELQLKIMQLKQHIVDMEEQNQSKKSRTRNKKEVNSSFQVQLDDRVSQSKSKYQSPKQEPVQEHKLSEEESKQIRKRTVSNPIENQQELQQSLSPIQSNKNLQSNEKKQKLPKVQNQDVVSIGCKLKFQMMAQQVEQDQIDNIFVDYNTISIKELNSLLGASPFNLSNENERTLLSRYMIEDNSNSIVYYDETLTNDVQVVKSILKNLIGRYQIFYQQESQEMDLQLSNVLVKFKTSLIDQLKIISTKKKQHIDQCDLEDLKSAIKFCNIHLDPRQKEYMTFLLYLKYGNQTLFDYRSFLDCFQLVSPTPQFGEQFTFLNKSESQQQQ